MNKFVFTNPSHNLPSGQQMPMVGLGTYLITESNLIWKVLDEALSVGYRLIDTAAMYGNEQEIGKALKKLLPKHNLSRKDVFITSKLPPTNHGDRALDSLYDTLSLLQLNYLDLYLIHWPGSSDCEPQDPLNEELRNKSWSKLVEAKRNGIVKSIGVSNYSIAHLKSLFENSCGEKPVVNQVEWHPHCHDDNLKAFCDKNEILLQAYFSFGGTERKALLSDPIVLDVATRMEKRPSQILLRWSLQQNVAVIPKATARQHLLINMDLNFPIPDNYMIALSALPQERYGCNPNMVA